MLQRGPSLLVTLEMYVAMMATLTCHFRDVRFYDGHISLFLWRCTFQ